jgi:hypothetical protein
VNDGKSGLEAETVRALGALHSMRSKTQLAAEKQREMHFLRNTVKEKWFEHYVEGETAWARKQLQGVEAADQQERPDVKHAEIMGLTNGGTEKTFKEIIVDIGDSLSDLASPNDGEDGEYQDDEETEQGKLSRDDKPRWVIGAITRMVLRRMEMFHQKKTERD